MLKTGVAVVMKVRKRKRPEPSDAIVLAQTERPLTSDYRIIKDTLICTDVSIEDCGIPVLMHGNSVASLGCMDADGSLSFSLPPCLFGGQLDVLDATSGRSLGIGPIKLPGADTVVWGGWSCVRGRITGQFRLNIPDDSWWTPPPVLPVVIVHAGDALARAFGRHEGAGAYTFHCVVPRLLKPDEFLMVGPVLAGETLQEQLVLTPNSMGVIGNLDSNEGAVAGGWAVDLKDRTRRVEIDIRVNGQSVAISPAHSQRDDLLLLGLSDGRSGFRLMLPNVDLDRNTLIQAFVAGTEIELTGSPRTLTAFPTVAGSFDGLNGVLLSGWVIDRNDPGTPVEVEAVCDGEVVGTCLANAFRPDVAAAGMPTGRCGFMFSLDRPVRSLLDRDIDVRQVGATTVLEGSPQRINKDNVVVRFMMRGDLIRPQSLARLTRRLSYETRNTRISIIMPVYNTRSDWLLEALNSVLNQWSANWELICVDDASPLPHVAAVLSAAMRHDKRIKVIRAPENVGIARATNLGLRAATGEYVAFMDHDDVIEPDAIHKLAKAAQVSDADLIYSDEVVTGADISGVLEVRARPSFSHDYYLSHPYFVHMVCIRRALSEQLGGWDESLKISGDVDFVLRAIEKANAVAHVPSVLYRWRTHEASEGHAKKGLVTATMKKILTGHLARLGIPATVGEGTGYNQHRIDWLDDGGEVLIIIPTKNRGDLLRTCIDSIERTSVGANFRIVVIDHESDDPKTVAYLADLATRHTVMPYSGAFNYALMNNLAVNTHGGSARYVIFCNNDVEAVQSGWVQRLRSLVRRPDVGAAGPLLLYGDDRVQHAGVLMAFSGAADHVGKFQAAYSDEGKRNPGYNCILSSTRDYSAVTAACIIVRRDVLTKMGGFDERFVVGFNDTDLCLRIVEAGYRILYDGQTVLYHHESATRSASNELTHPEDDALLRTRWAKYFRDGDPFYSPLLNDKGIDHILTNAVQCTTRTAARVIPRSAALVGEARAQAVVRSPRRRRKVAAVD